MNKLYKMAFTLTLVMGTLISVSSYSWMGVWLGLEINLLSIIPLMKKKSMLSSEAALKYFITQTLASLILMLSMIMMMSKTMLTNESMMSSFSIMMNSSLLTKMGAAPFHFWFPEIMDGLSWNLCMIMLTWQKIAPMMVMLYSPKPFMLMIASAMMSMLISGLMAMNQVSVRKIMAFSSINHIGWMIMSMLISEVIWLIYFSIYTLITINTLMILKKMNSFFIKQLIASMKSNKLIKLSMMVNFLSLGGLPPFIGFMPKWLVIQYLTTENFMLMATFMMVTSLIMLYVYLSMMMTSMTLINSEIKWLTKSTMNSSLMMKLNFIINVSLIFSPLLFLML